MEAALGRFDEFNKFPDVGRTVQLRANLFKGLCGVEFGAEEEAKGSFDCFETRAIESAALEADGVHAVAFRFALSDDSRKRRHVLGDDGAGADVGVAAHAAELVDRTERADIHVVFDDDVAGQCRAVGKHGRAADDAIVGHVRISHEKIVISDLRDASAARRAAAHGGEFAEPVAVADDQLGVLSPEFQILRIAAHRTKRIENALASDARGTAHHGMRFQDAFIA